jgi:hypothetical protein
MAPMTSSDPNAASLLALVAAHGGTATGISVRASGSERGLFADVAFASGAEILVVPPSLIVASPAVAASAAGARLRRVLGSDADPALLAFWLTGALAGPAPAPVAAWCALLPTRLDHLPVHYGKRGRDALDGTAFLGRVDARRARLAEEHALLVEAGLLTPETCSIAAWSHARSLATSRSFGTPDGEALVPIADLLNHHPDPGTTWTCDARRGFVLRTTRPLPADSEIRTSYGRKSNARLLLAYGFTLPDNPDLDMELSLGELGAFRLGLSTEDAEARRLLTALGAETGADARARALHAFAGLCRRRLAALPEKGAEAPPGDPLAGANTIREEEGTILGAWARLCG